jgi:hypothetical protein
VLPYSVAGLKEGIVELPKLDSASRQSEDAARTETKQRELNEYLKSLIGGSAGIALVTAYLFLSGYAFIDRYYRFFGLEVSALDFPAYYPLVNSVWLVQVIVPLLWFAVIVFPGRYLLWDLSRKCVPLRIGLLWIYCWSKRKNRALLRRTLRRKLRWLYRRWSKRRNWARVRNAEPKPDYSRLADWSEKINWLFFACVIFVVILGKALTDGRQEAQKDYDHPDLKTTLVFKTEVLHDLDAEFLKENSEGNLRGLRETKDFVVVFVRRELVPKGRVVVVSIPMANLISVRNESLL